MIVLLVLVVVLVIALAAEIVATWSCIEDRDYDAAQGGLVFMVPTILVLLMSVYFLGAS